jgi:hypothetical protein
MNTGTGVVGDGVVLLWLMDLAFGATVSFISAGEESLFDAYLTFPPVVDPR